MARHFEGFKLVKYEWSKYWYVTGGDIGRISTNKTNREEAEKFRASLITELSKRQNKTLTVSDALDDYMKEHAQYLPSKATTGYYMVPLLDFFGDMQAEEVPAYKVREFVEKQRKELKDGTIRRQLTILSAALNHAKKEGRISSPSFIPMPSSAPPKERWLTQKEASKLLAVAEGHVRLFILLALHTGQRKGAILELKWSQVDLKNNRIDFNPPNRAQTSKKRSAVPIMDSDLLKALHKAKGTGNVIKYHGKPVMDIKKAFKQACEKAKLKDVTPHTLRHTAGTWMAQGKVDMWQISGVLGHSNSRTTELYLKHSPDHLKGAIGKIAINLMEIGLVKRAKSAKRAKGAK